MKRQGGGCQGDSVLPELGEARPRPFGVLNLLALAVGFLKS